MLAKTKRPPSDAANARRALKFENDRSDNSVKLRGLAKDIVAFRLETEWRLSQHETGSETGAIICSGFHVKVRHKANKTGNMLGNHCIFIPAKLRKDFCNLRIAEMLKDLTKSTTDGRSRFIRNLRTALM